MLEKYIAFVKAHERLLVILACLLTAHHGYTKALDYFDRHASDKSKADQVVVNADVVTNKQLSGELALLRAQVAADTAKSIAAIQQAQAAAKQQQTIDQTLPLPDLAKRWILLVDLQPTDVMPAPDSKLVLTDAGARATVKQLEIIPALQTEVTQTKAQLAGCNTESAKKDDVIAGQEKTIADKDKKAADDAKTAKDDRRKSFWKGTKWGAGITAAVGILIKVALIVK
jgi:hypothetical protein